MLFGRFAVSVWNECVEGGCTCLHVCVLVAVHMGFCVHTLHVFAQEGLAGSSAAQH